MIELALPDALNRVVCIGAHPDDIEIGSGATISILAAQHPGAEFTFLIPAGNRAREEEARISASDLLSDRVDVLCGRFRDGHLPYNEPGAVKDFLRGGVAGMNPDLVLCPSRTDLHQDHRFVAELAHQIFRDQLILEYEIPKYDGDLGRPSAYVGFAREHADAKAEHLMSHFSSQHDKPWYQRDSFLAMMRIRGLESGSPGPFAEAFYVSKISIRSSSKRRT